MSQASSPPLQFAGIALDDPDGPIYLFSPNSKKSNDLTINVTNPLMRAIPNAPNAQIEITLPVSETDPTALTTAALALVIQAMVSAFDRNWGWNIEQKTGTTVAIVLKPQGETIVGGGAHSLIQITLSGIVSHFPEGPVEIHVAVSGFELIADTQADLTLHRGNYPAPNGSFAIGPASIDPDDKILATWSVERADTLTVSFGGNRLPAIAYAMADGSIGLQAQNFELVGAALLSGEAKIVATNESAGPNSWEQTIQVQVSTPAVEIRLGAQCGVSPAALLGKLTQRSRMTPGGEGFCVDYKMAFVGEIVPDFPARLSAVPIQPGGDFVEEASSAWGFDASSSQMQPGKPSPSGTLQMPGCGTVNWRVDFGFDGVNLTLSLPDALANATSPAIGEKGKGGGRGRQA